MDELCLRFLKKIGVTNLDYYQNCSLKVNANDKESGICYVTFTSRDCFQYVAAKELLDKLDSSPFKTSVTFVYENPITPDQAYALLRDELFYNTGLDQDKMPYCTKKKNELFFMFYGKIHYDTFAPVVQMWEELFDQLDIPYDIRTDISYANEEIMKERERLFDEGLRNSIKENYKNRMDVIYSQEENHQRVKGNYKKVNIC